METSRIEISYRGRSGDVKKMLATVHSFTNIQEAIERLGEDVVLQHINYSYGLMERQKLISQARAVKV